MKKKVRTRPCIKCGLQTHNSEVCNVCAPLANKEFFETRVELAKKHRDKIAEKTVKIKETLDIELRRLESSEQILQQAKSNLEQHNKKISNL